MFPHLDNGFLLQQTKVHRNISWLPEIVLNWNRACKRK